MEARSGTTFGSCFGPIWGHFLKQCCLKKIHRNHRNPGLEMKHRATFVKLTHVTSAIRCDDFSQSGYTLGCKECFALLPCKVYLVTKLKGLIKFGGLAPPPNRTGSGFFAASPNSVTAVDSSGVGPLRCNRVGGEEFVSNFATS